MMTPASKDANIQIKLFDKLTLESKYSEPKTKRNNITGEATKVSERLNVSGRITRLLEKKTNK